MAELLGSDCERECSRDSRLNLRHGADSGSLHRVRRASGACIRRRSATERAALLHEFGVAEVGEANLESRPRPTWRCAGALRRGFRAGSFEPIGHGSIKLATPPSPITAKRPRESAPKCGWSRLSRMRLHTLTMIRDLGDVFLGNQSLRPVQVGARREIGIFFRAAAVMKERARVLEEDWEAGDPAESADVRKMASLPIGK